MLDPTGIVTSWNPGVRRILGYDEPEFLGLPFTTLFPSGDADAAGAELTRARDEGQAHDERWHRRKDGSLFWASGVLTALRGEEGALRGFATVMRDNTERKRHEEHLEAALKREHESRELAERASRAKDEFLALVSHELRTPLNAVLGWTRMLRHGHLDAGKTAKALETVERNAEAQTHLIEDLLDISRIMTGKLSLDMRPVMLPSVTRAALDALQPEAAAKGISLDVEIDAGGGPVAGDAARLQQVVWNLVSNAIKFTNAGGRVAVRLERLDQEVRLTVEDTGVGIAQEFLPHIFERFRQAAPSRSSHGGLGLGLAVSRQLIEMHGGRVVARSEGAGRGATFVVTLPLAEGAHRGALERLPVHDLQAQLDGPPEIRGLNVLLVDDDEDSRDLQQFVLEYCGVSVTCADSVEAALDAIDRQAPDVVVSDVRMPDQDGFALIRQLRRREISRGGRIPAAAVTALTRAEDRTRLLAAGFQTHIPKPVEPAELVAAVAALAKLVGKA